MGLFRRIAGFLGIGNHDHDSKDAAADEHDVHPGTTPYRVRETGRPRKGFSVPAQVVVDRHHVPPVLTLSTSGDGGLQGLSWYTKHLTMDEDGDVADEFLEEVLSVMPEGLGEDRHKTQARFKSKKGTKEVRVNKQILLDGKIILHCVEHQGRL